MERETPSKSKSYREERKKYDMEKRRRKKEMLRDRLASELGDTILADWIKVRSRLKNWHKFWGVIYPGKLVLYDDEACVSWKGTMILANLEVHERPTKKSGFSFKCTTEFGSEIFAKRGPRGEFFYNFNILPTDSCILRVSNQETGMSVEFKWHALDFDDAFPGGRGQDWMDEIIKQQSGQSGQSRRLSKSFSTSRDVSLTEIKVNASGRCDPQDIEELGKVDETEWVTAREPFVVNGTSPNEQVGVMNDVSLEILWKNMQGMTSGNSGSARIFPAGMLESRSLLEKMADTFATSAILADAARADSPKLRIMGVTKWLLAGLCTRTAGLPMLPVKGEVYRCAFGPPDSFDGGERKFSNRTFVVCEQVLSDPPTSAVMATNREAGWCVYGSTSGKVRLWGNSTSFEITSTIRVVLLGDEPEQYTITLPDCILHGLASGCTFVEFVGTASIVCDDSESELKLNFTKARNTKGLGANGVTGEYYEKGAVKGAISGEWSKKVILSESSEETLTVFANDESLKAYCAKKKTVPKESLLETESTRVWTNVIRAQKAGDAQDADTAFVAAHAKPGSSQQQFFTQEAHSDGRSNWMYKFTDLRKWDPDVDCYITSKDGIIQTLDNAACSAYAGDAHALLSAQNSPAATPAKSQASRLASRRSSVGADDVDATNLQSEIAALRKRVQELEDHKDQFLHVYMPLLGLLFAIIQTLLPIVFQLSGVL